MRDLKLCFFATALVGAPFSLHATAAQADELRGVTIEAEASTEPTRDAILEPKVDKDKDRKASPLGFSEVYEAGPIAIGLGGGITSPEVAGTGVAGLMAGRIEVFWAELQLKPGPSNTGAVYIGNRRYGYRTGEAYIDGWYDKGLFLGSRMFRVGTKNSYKGDNRPGATLRHDFRAGADFEMDVLSMVAESTAEAHLIPYIGLLYAFEVKASQADDVPTHYGGIDVGVLFGAALGDVLSLRGWAGAEARGSGEDGDNSNDGINDTELTYLEAGLGIGALFVMGPIPTEIELLYNGRIDTSGEPDTWGETFDFDVLLSFSWRPSGT